MDKETEALADKYLKDAGYDPDIVRGRTTDADLQRAHDAQRRAAWRYKNSLKAPAEKQIGLSAPAPEPEPSGRGMGSVLFGFFLGRWL